MRRFTLSTISLSGLVMVAACGGTGGANSDDPNAPVTLGMIQAETGQSAPFGLQAEHGVRAVAKRINGAGGIKDDCGHTHKIKLTTFDMANDGAQAVSGIRKFAADKSILTSIGPTPSTGFLSMIPAAKSLKFPVISPGSGAKVDSWNPWAFRTTVSSPIGDPVMAEVVGQQLKYKDIGIMYDVTQDDQASTAKLDRDLASKDGYNVVGYESFRAGDTDFRPQLTKLNGNGVAHVWIFAAIPEMTKIINQMGELGMLKSGAQPSKDVLIHAGGGQDPTTWKLTGGKVAGAITYSPDIDFAGSDNPAAVQFGKDYTAEAGNPPTPYATYGAQAAYAAVAAIQKSCDVFDRDKFRKALSHIELMSPAGPVQFGNDESKPNGENLRAKDNVRVFRITGDGTSQTIFKR